MILCNICRRPHHPQKRPFLCPVDVRNNLYEGRINNATLLLENEQLETKINSYLANGVDLKPSSTSAEAEAKTVRLNTLQSESRRSQEYTQDMEAQADRLRDGIAARKREVEEMKAANSRQKKDLASASDGLRGRRQRLLDDTERAIRKTNQNWDSGHEKLAATRSFLCMESARLFGVKRIRKGPSSRYEYHIGGIEILGLIAMNEARSEMVSASLANIAHILVLASQYLTIRLPAEITLPHKDYPRPTIFPIDSSYRPGEAQFPGSQPSLVGDADHQRRARPRPLYLEKTLKTLARDDPTAYSFFLEGIALLGYDIVWACTTQGVYVGDKDSIEDFCNFGKNLYNLLIGNSLYTNSAGRIYQASTGQAAAASTAAPGGDGADIIQATMGKFSHGAAHDNLCSAEGTEFLRKHKSRLPLPIKIAEKLKRKLNPIPDWELLEHPDSLEDTVLVCGADTANSATRVRERERERDRRASFGIESLMTEMNMGEQTPGTAAPAAPAAGGSDDSAGPNPGRSGPGTPTGISSPPQTRAMSGTNGWTKLRSR
ncbi:uncharacterized protein MKZ38_009919 [Zalerion maritima]|uniref:Autophagy-related protein 14 n=1 Tax=Zalerion maritima TaxID=339359 RepID=A0AAD5RSV5_9PEZI|nr:uncharacterized protein MKZ38_009919 [Zalerion maritima]